MRAVTVIPHQAASAALSDVEEPSVDAGEVVVDTIAVGVCGTDMEIVRGTYGWLPPGRERLVLGHESLGRVAEAPAGSGLNVGDLVVGIVRRPDPEPCPACAVGQWDACRNGNYTEHGIKSLDGFMRERYRAHADSLVTLDPRLGAHGVLLEPTTVVAKAWQQTLAIGHRAVFEPRTVLVIGAGPIGLLAALMGTQMGYEVHVVDQVTAGRKPALVAQLGAKYHTGSPSDVIDGGADVVIECTGVPSVIQAAMVSSAIGGVVCLTGISPIGTTTTLDLGSLAHDMVLGNRAVFGSVNANRTHYEAAARVLADAPIDWLDGVISRRVPIGEFSHALERHDDDVKVVIDIGS